MMQRLSPAWFARLLSLILLLGAAGGCEKQDRYMTAPDDLGRGGSTAGRDDGAAQDEGGFNLFDFSPSSIHATKVVVVRTMGGSGLKPDRDGTLSRPENGQLLSINLFTGALLFEDADGQRYPNQLANETTSQLRQQINPRKWVSAARSVRADAQSYVYTMQAYADDQPHKDVASWTDGTAESHPVFQTLGGLFVRQHRRAHPLSDDVNILLNKDR
jgi:hypothetical protein